MRTMGYMRNEDSGLLYVDARHAAQFTTDTKSNSSKVIIGEL